MSLIHKFKQCDNYFVIDVNTGAVHVVDELIFDILDEDKLLDLNSLIDKLSSKYSEDEIKEAYMELTQLINEGMLYTEDLYENIAKSSESSESFIKALCLNIAHDCNLKCKYCFADEGEYKGKREIMSAEVGKKAIDFVIEKSGSRKNIEIDLFGGEPLIAFDVVKEIVEYAKSIEKNYNKTIRFTMTTNATLLNDEIIDYIDKNMGNIVLSIDGRKEVNDSVRVNREGKGCYDNILPKIKKMVDIRDKSKQYYVRGTFTRDNTDFYEDVMHLADLGFEEISIEPVVLPEEHPLSLRKEELPQIFLQYDKLCLKMMNDAKFKFYHFNIDLQGGPCVYKRISACGAGHEYVAITPKGDIYPCHQFVGNEEFKIGSIFNSEINKEISDKFKKAHIYNKPLCKQCWARFYCSGGCHANNYNFNGTLNVPYELGCEMQKKRIECAIAIKSKFASS